MDRTHLISFINVAKYQNFSHAAQLLHISQPAISMHIQVLEEHCGTRLLQRNTKHVSLTPAGQMLLRYASDIILLFEQAEKEIRQMANVVRGQLVLGASLTIGGHVLPPMLKEFQDLYPEVRITMAVQNTEQIALQVHRNQIDMGLVEAPVSLEGLSQNILDRDELILVLPITHSLAGRAYLSLEEFIQQPMVLREPGSGTRDVLEEALIQRGIDPTSLKVTLELGATEAVKSAVKAGSGIAVLSAWTVREEVHRGEFWVARIHELSFFREFICLTNPHRFPTAVVEAFTAYLQQASIEHRFSADFNQVAACSPQNSGKSISRTKRSPA